MKRKSLGKTFRMAAAVLLGGGMFLSPATGNAEESMAAEHSSVTNNVCPAFADFKRPTAPEFRVPKKRLDPDPFIRTQQMYLEILGIGEGNTNGIKGARTQQDLREFQFFWGPLYHGEKASGKFDEETIDQLYHFADLAYKDSKVYGIPTEAAAAIRLSQLYTGVEFGLLMELTAAESGFRSQARARTSSAKGLQQFIDRTWLNMIRQYGHKYGLGSYAEQISYYKDDYGRDIPQIENPIVHRQVLDMKNNPRLSALMAGDFITENRTKLSCFLKKSITRTDIYLAHFLGPNDSILFLDAMQKNPAGSAADLFPEAAEANKPIFFNWHGSERSFRDIYDMFDRRFNLDKYEDWATDPQRAARINSSYSLSSYVPPAKKTPSLRQERPQKTDKPAKPAKRRSKPAPPG